MSQFHFKTTPQICVCIGKPKRGKTYTTFWMILKHTVDPRSKIFKYGIVFSQTANFNHDYDYIPEKYIYEGYNPEILQQYLDGIKKQKHIQPSFIIFDDIQGLLNSQDPVLNSLIACHRHYKISLFFNFQAITGHHASFPLLRDCATIAIVFNAKGERTLRALYENFGQLFDDFQSFKKYFLDLTSEQFVAMLYLQDVDNIEDNYLYFKCPPNMNKFKDIKLDY